MMCREEYWKLMNNYLCFRNAEDIKRDDTEPLTESEQVLTLDGEVLSLNGNVVGERPSSAPEDEADQLSVCSCSCLGPSQCKSHVFSLDDIYHPTVTKRSSVWKQEYVFHVSSFYMSSWMYV